jgi:3-hydroxyisobutyrate dehydrogenase-like beta-hydroxyacid dehydrogenase
MPNIAYLGTGLLGSAFVEAALSRGDQVTVWNRTAAKAQALQQYGATVADTPADAVRGVERVHLVLRDDDSVDEVIAQCRTALAVETIILDHTTTLPDRTAERARRLATEGVRYLHCPVFVGPAAARKAGGIILAAGPRHLFDAVSAALQPQAARIEYLGERPDLGAAIKLAGNAFIVGTAGLVADALAVGKGAQVDSDFLLDILGWFPSTNVVNGRGRAMVRRDYAPGFELSMARKDLALMIETAGPDALAMLPGLAARMDALLAEGHHHDDLAVVGIQSVHADNT